MIITLSFGFLFIFAGIFFNKSSYMTLSRYFLISICCVFLFFTSCKDSKEYNVNSAFTEYLQRFEAEGLSRGHTFDPQNNGLIIEFADLKDNTAGLTHYEKPIRIEIDKTYWNDISKRTGADAMKEDLIFHELGHGLLNRNHLNSTLPNGDWKSIMCGGDKVNNRSWNINYRGIRHKYYIDELFNESTPVPDFASTQLPVDTTGFSPFLTLNFDTPTQSGWVLGDFTDYTLSSNKGGLLFHSKAGIIYLVSLNLKDPIAIGSNFTFEMTLNYPAGDATNQYGLIFGPVPDGTSAINAPIEFFSIDNNRNMYMGNRSWYSYFTELSETSIVSTGNNHLKVVKIGQLLYYFINNVYCYSSEIVASGTLNQFGFMVPPLGDVWVDNFQISTNGSSNSPSKVKQNQPIEFNIQKTNQFDLNKIKNQ